MSAFDKVHKGKAHKERSQPSYRKHKGLLEKKKDYKARAKDYQFKKRKLKALKRKAALRNPDEFYFGMNHTHLEGGVHSEDVDKHAAQVSKEAIQKATDQDLVYLTVRQNMEQKKVEKLQQNFHLIGQAQNKHVVYVDTEEDKEEFSPTEYFQTTEEMLTNKHNRLKTDQLKTLEIVGLKKKNQAEKEIAAISKKRTSAYRELMSRAGREKKIEDMKNELELRKATMSKKPHKVINVPGGKPIVKFKRVRNK
eukprot:TRINITY_DN11057_c0_g1_i1.p1 TRINITY_DN11057_c0_g1~~TRINITY_DN11057_c0_g1_i1.p1  ORF type:complete len:252 (-),score=79.98 TRINITY_DN11057_c0_g1_i1:67-822(-)